MGYRLLEDSNYRAGMIREVPSWKLPPGALADCSNMIFDVPGIARQRNGTLNLVSGAQTAFATSLGFCYSQGASVIEELYGPNGKTNVMNVIDKSTGAATAIGTAFSTGTPVIVGRSIRHFGFCFFPGTDVGDRYRQATAVAGAVANVSFANTVNAQATAGNSQITLTGVDVTTNVRVGQIVQILVPGVRWAFFRVVSVDTAKLFSVWPTPTFTDAAMPAASVQCFPTFPGIGGTCGTSFQNRLLLANVNEAGATGFGQINERRIIYSPLPTETWTSPVGAGLPVLGAGFVYVNQWPLLNYIDVPGADPIIAMEPVSDNELLVLTSGGVVVFNGTLATQTTTSAPGVTWSVYTLPTTAGCLSDLSVQKTPIGVVWASAEGIYAYWPPLRRSPAHTGLRDMTEESLNKFWRSKVRGSSFAIHGSMYVRGHYVLSYTSGGTTEALCLNVGTGAWSIVTGAGLDVFLGVLRPTDPSQCFAVRWWDQTGAAPSFTNGQTIRSDTVFAPDVIGQTKIDSDGAVIPFTAKTRTLTDDQETERIVRRVGVRYALEAAGANVTVAVGSRLDSVNDTGGTPTVSLGSLSNTAVLTITGQSNATPIVITTSTNHGLQEEDWVDIRGVTTNSNANGRWKIHVISNTTFSLNGSSGNGATTSTGTCKKVTEQEFAAPAADIGQGNWLSIASNGTVNRFELHGVRVGAMEFGRGMGQ